MADLDTSGFQLQELPPPQVIPNSLLNFDVSKVYDAAKAGLDLADQYQQMNRQAYVAPAQEQAALSQAAGQIQTQPSATAAGR